MMKRWLRWMLFTMTERQVIAMALNGRRPTVGPGYDVQVVALNAMRKELDEQAQTHDR